MYRGYAVHHYRCIKYRREVKKKKTITEGNGCGIVTKWINYSRGYRVAIKRREDEASMHRREQGRVQQVLQGIKMVMHASYLESAECTFERCAFLRAFVRSGEQSERRVYAMRSIYPNITRL